MSSLRPALADYLELRRALGYKLVRTERLLRQFLDHLDAAGTETVSIQTALAWACQPYRAHPKWRAARLSAVRGFAAYLHAFDPAVEVPPTDLLPARTQRACPYLYSEADIAALLAAAGTLPTPLRRATLATLIGLLAVTGMRVGEAIGLDCADLDTGTGTLTIRAAKFGKNRHVLLHPSSVAALRDYLGLHERQAAPHAHTGALFISTAGTRLIYQNVHRTFHDLVQIAGLQPRSPACRPRIHDLRHSFAVWAMLDAYTAGEDGQHRLALVATWLGHVDPGSTYWYLSASPELMAVAGQRLEHHLIAESAARR